MGGIHAGKRDCGIHLEAAAGAAPVLRVETHGGMYGTAGIPDIVACDDGRFVAFEVKRPGGKPTALQTITLGRIRASGGVAEMVTSAQQAQAVLDGRAVE